MSWARNFKRRQRCHLNSAHSVRSTSRVRLHCCWFLCILHSDFMSLQIECIYNNDLNKWIVVLNNFIIQLYHAINIVHIHISFIQCSFWMVHFFLSIHLKKRTFSIFFITERLHWIQNDSIVTKGWRKKFNQFQIFPNILKSGRKYLFTFFKNFRRFPNQTVYWN